MHIQLSKNENCTYMSNTKSQIAHCKNARGLGQIMGVFLCFKNCDIQLKDKPNLRPKIESLYGLGRQAQKRFVWNFSTFARLPYRHFSTENSPTLLGSFSFIDISVEMFRFSI